MREYGTVNNKLTLPVICKDAEDNVISQSDVILERWKDYFCKILNIPEAIIMQTIIRERTNNQPQIPLPSYNEMCFIINNLKLNKAAGSDNIPPELLKHGGRTLKQKLQTKTTNSMALVRTRTIPTERPPPVGEVSANFCG